MEAYARERSMGAYQKVVSVIRGAISDFSAKQWALGRDGIKAQIDEFGSIKPCIWGSDAHSYDRMFCPDNDRFCWIKAEPTFEGLQQILYEPADRVRLKMMMACLKLCEPFHFFL